MAKIGCDACIDGIEPPFPFTMAFQPIIDLRDHSIFAYEALVRGPGNESAFSILSQVTDENRYAFDQSCRVRAIQLAARLGMGETGASLSINFLPNAVYNPAACIQATLKAAREFNFPENKLIFEITESEKVRDQAHLSKIIDEYRKRGFRTAIDDFGAGYAGLNLLTDFRPDIVKIDMELIRNIDQHPVKQIIVESILALSARLTIMVIAEGIETTMEMETLRGMGVHYFQGYLFARPGFETLPAVDWLDIQAVPALA